MASASTPGPVPPGVPSLVPPPLPKPPRPIKASAPPLYTEVMQRMSHAKLDPDVSTRQEFIDYFNRDIAPRLTMEEAYLQWLVMRMVRFYLPLYARLAVHITHDRHRKPVRRYGDALFHTAVTRDKVNGGTAHLFEPGYWASQPACRDAILVFGGSSTHLPLPGTDGRDVLLEDDPQGLRADVDPGGIGKTAFEANSKVWLGWVRRILGRGQDVTLVGYSLGGALATRVLAALTPEEQARCRLVTFQAPGIDGPTAAAVQPGLDNVLLINNPHDFVTAAGSSHPPGLLVETQMPSGIDCHPHLVPSLVVSQIEKNPPRFDEHDGPHATHPAVEVVRQVAGLAYPHLPG